MSRPSGHRKLDPRYERHPRNYLAFLGLAAALCCCKRFVRLTAQGTVFRAVRAGVPVADVGWRSTGVQFLTYWRWEFRTVRP